MSSHPRLAWAIAALAGLIIAALVVLALTSALGAGGRASLDRMPPALTAGAPASPDSTSNRDAARTQSTERSRRKPRHHGDDHSSDIDAPPVIRPQDRRRPPTRTPGADTGGQAQLQPRRHGLRAEPIGQHRSGVPNESETDDDAAPEPELTPEPTPRRAPNPVAALQPITIPEPEPTPTATPEAGPRSSEPSPDGADGE
jgi:hypothetical protein